MGHKKSRHFENLFNNAWMHPNKELVMKGAAIVATHCEDPVGSGSNS
jgi:hypothetical protein